MADDTQSLAPLPSADPLYDPSSLEALGTALDTQEFSLNAMLEQNNPPEQTYLNKKIYEGGPTFAQAEQYGISSIASVGEVWNGYQQMQAANTQASLLDFESKTNLMRATQTVGTILGPEESYQLGEIGQKGAQVMSAQRAIYASQNVMVNSGTAKVEQGQTETMTAAAKMNQRTQDALKAYGVTAEAEGIAGQQQLQALGLEKSGQQSFLLGGAQALQTLAGTYEEAQRNKAYFGGNG